MTEEQLLLTNGTHRLLNHSEINGNQSPEELTHETITEMENLGIESRRNKPAFKTARTKLHEKRSSVNVNIEKQLKLLNGANNLLRAVNDRRLKSKVMNEVDYVQTNLHLLKEQLDEINSSLEIYQDTSDRLPLIPLGLKHAPKVDFLVPFSDFILEHYSEEPRPYEGAIAQISAMRERAVDPERTARGLQDLHEYIAALNVIDVRFFPAGRKLGVHFEWHDSLTGESRLQNSVAFEKASLFYNLAGLYSQIAVRQDRRSPEDCAVAQQRLCAAAGLLQVLRDSFTNPASPDLRPEILDLLIPLLLTQAQEAALQGKAAALKAATAKAEEKEKAAAEDDEEWLERAERLLKMSGEAAWISESYEQLSASLAAFPDHLRLLPPLWSSLVKIKVSFFAAEAFGAASRALLALTAAPSPREAGVVTSIDLLGAMRKDAAQLRWRRPRTFDEMRRLARAKMAEAASAVDDARRSAGACKEVVTRTPGVLRFLEAAHASLNRELDAIHIDDPLSACFVAFEIKGEIDSEPEASVPESFIPPYKDPFNKLGPISIFSSRHFWSPPRLVRLRKHPELGFGFSVRGEAPVLVIDVEPGGPALAAGVKAGDFIVEVNGIDVKWARHQELIAAIRDSGEKVTLRVVTPLDVDYLNPTPPAAPPRSANVSRAPSTGSLFAGLFTKRFAPKAGPSEPSLSGASNTVPSKGGRKWRPRLSGGSLFWRGRSKKTRASYEFTASS